jgi:hypothetical protein
MGHKLTPFRPICTITRFKTPISYPGAPTPLQLPESPLSALERSKQQSIGLRIKRVKQSKYFSRITGSETTGAIETDSRGILNVNSLLPSRETQRDLKRWVTKQSWLQVIPTSYDYSRDQPDGREEERRPKPVNGRPSPHLWRNCRPVASPACHFELKEGAIPAAIHGSRPVSVPLMPRLKQELDLLEKHNPI